MEGRLGGVGCERRRTAHLHTWRRQRKHQRIARRRERCQGKQRRPNHAQTRDVGAILGTIEEDAVIRDEVGDERAREAVHHSLIPVSQGADVLQQVWQVQI